MKLTISGRTRGAAAHWRYELIEQLEERRKIGSLLLFTGTPHRGKDFQFYSLMRLVRRDLFDPDGDDSLNLANLRQAMIRNNKASVTDLHGHRIFTSVTTAKRDYAYSPAEAHFYATLTTFISEGRTHAASFTGRAHTARGLLLTTIQKLAASSVAAVRNALLKRREMLEKAKEKALGSPRDRRPIDVVSTSPDPSDEVSEAEEELPASEPKLDLVHDEIRWLGELIDLSRSVEHETKIRRLVSMVEDEFESESILLFTEYKATQALVVNALRENFGFDTCAFINGDERLEGVRSKSGDLESWVQLREGAARAFNAGEARFPRLHRGGW